MKKIDGIDVSRWQQYINWPVVAQNVQFAMMKLGGSENGMFRDSFAQRNAMETREIGLPHGFYVYLGGVHSPAEEVAHIKNLVHSVGGLQPGEVLALDWEESHDDEVAYLTEIVERLIDAGFAPPMIYMSLSRVRSHDWGSLVRYNCGLWVAAWGDNDDKPESNEVPDSHEWPFWAIWQYSSTGRVPGISGRVDLNIFAGSVEDFEKYGGERPVKQPTAIPVGKPQIDQSSMSVYVVKKGDSLSKIASRFDKSWQQLWALNRDLVSQPSMIYPGQKLRVWGATHKSPQKPTTPKQGNREYIVKPGDSLVNIADKFGIGAKNWRVIYDLNRKTIGRDPNKIYPGTLLRLP